MFMFPIPRRNIGESEDFFSGDNNGSGEGSWAGCAEWSQTYDFASYNASKDCGRWQGRHNGNGGKCNLDNL